MKHANLLVLNYTATILSVALHGHERTYIVDLNPYIYVLIFLFLSTVQSKFVSVQNRENWTKMSCLEEKKSMELNVICPLQFIEIRWVQTIWVQLTVAYVLSHLYVCLWNKALMQV